MPRHNVMAFMLIGVFLLTAWSVRAAGKDDGSPSCPQPSSSLAVTLIPQETSMWCWAASGEMVMEFLGTDVTQCDQANKRFGRSDCCNFPVPVDCIDGGWPEFNKYGFTWQMTSDTALTWDQLKNEIDCEKKPFAFSWHWLGMGGHMMVVTGYNTTSTGTNMVHVNDPGPPNVGDFKVLTYDAYVSGPDHTHWDDYYDVTATRMALEAMSTYAQPYAQKMSALTAAAANEADEVAISALETFHELVTEQNFRDLGFNSLDEVGSAQLGDPVMSVYVRLDRLRNYQETEEPIALFSGSGEKLIYPIFVNGDPRASITLEKSAAGWQATEYGAPGFSQLFFTLLDPPEIEIESGPTTEDVSFFAVSVPALGFYFLGTQSGTDVYLTSISDDLALEMERGTTLPAREVLAKLVPFAQAINGLPR